MFRPWDTGVVSTVATLCVLWHFCPLANEQSQTFSVFQKASWVSGGFKAPPTDTTTQAFNDEKKQQQMEEAQITV